MAASRRVTIHDIARLCGVSPTTVSHAFTGKRHVEVETRAQILAAAERVGYRPSRVAQALRSKRARVIGFVLPFIEGDSRHSRDFLSFEYFMRIVAVAAAEAFELGYALMLLPGAEQDGTLQSFGIDGVILCDPDDGDPRVALCKRIGLPLVTIGRDSAGGEGVPYVASDSAGNTRRLLDHMAEAGARRIGLFSTVSRSSWWHDSEAAYAAWCEARGVEAVVVRASLRRSGHDDRHVAARLLDSALRLDGVLALEEAHGLAFLEATRAAGLEVPRDMLLALAHGSTQAMLADPSLTAIDLKPDRQGRAAVQLLVRLMDGGAPEPFHATAAEIVVRGSTGTRPARVAGAEAPIPPAPSQPDTDRTRVAERSVTQASGAARGKRT